MKRFLFIAAATLVGLSLVGCSYDDSAIWDAMDELEEKVEQNAEDIATLSALIEASNQGKVITSTEYTAEGVKFLGDIDLNKVLSTILDANITLLSVNCSQTSFEEYYLSVIGGGKQ